MGHVASLFSLFVVELSDGCCVVCSQRCHYPLIVFFMENALPALPCQLLNNFPHIAATQTDNIAVLLCHNKLHFLHRAAIEITDACQVIVFFCDLSWTCHMADSQQRWTTVTIKFIFMGPWLSLKEIPTSVYVFSPPQADSLLINLTTN